MSRSPTGVSSLVGTLDSGSESEAERSDSCNPIKTDFRKSRAIKNGDTLCLSIASGPLVSPDGVAESLVTKTSESPNSPPLSGQG